MDGENGLGWARRIAVSDGIELRRWTLADAPALSAAVTANLEHLRPWMPWVAAEPVRPPVRRRLIEEWDKGWDAGTDRHFGIFAGGEAIGSIALMARVGPGAVEMGYWLDKARTGQGIVTAAARCLTTMALASPGIGRVEIHHDKANEASAGVPRRLGFRLVAEVAEAAAAPGESGVSWVWEATASRWKLPAGATETPEARPRP